MYSISRRTGCRLAFILLGILPLLATLVIAGWRNHEFDEVHFASLVSRVLGCRTTVDDVQFVRPGTVRLVNVNVRDAETGEPFLFLPHVDVQQCPQNVLLAISEARVHDLAVDRILFLIHERVLRQPDLFAVPIVATVGRLHCSQRRLETDEPDPHDSATYFVQNRFELRQIDQGSELRGELRQAAANVKPAIDLTIRRVLTELPTTTITLQTYDQWISASLLVGRQNWLPRLSPAASFRGNLHVDLDANGWSGEAYGDFRDVDLGPLVGDRFERFLTGNADFVVRTARFARGRLQEFDADIHAGPGEFGTRQLQAAAEAWQLEWSDPPEPDAVSIDYEQLATSVYLDKEGLELAGLCPGAIGTLLTVPSGAVLRHPQTQAVRADVSSIFGVLLPDAWAPQFQLTAEADSLLRVLPLPTANETGPAP